jgi:hypothetical protein
LWEKSAQPKTRDAVINAGALSRSAAMDGRFVIFAITDDR